MIRIITFRPEEKFRKINLDNADIINVPLTKIIKIKIEENTIQNEYYDYVIFTSSIAVESFKEQIKNYKEFLNGKKLIAIGSKTAEYLGMECTVPDIQSSKGIIDVVSEGSKVLLVRSKNGNPYLVKKLKEKGSVKIINAYKSIVIYDNFETIYKKLKNEYFDAAIFTSSLIFKSYITIFSRYGNPLQILPKIVIAIGDKTARTMKRYNINPVVMDIPDVEHSVKKIIDISQKIKI